MKTFWQLFLSLPTLFTACSDGPYQKKQGRWLYDGNVIVREQSGDLKPITGPFAKDAQFGYYRGVAIDGSDGPTFRPLDDHYAQDKARAYFFDTYRKGQEYYTQKHNVVVAMQEVSLGDRKSVV